ncbi:MAG: FAD-binding oxidoreductase [Planctomycetaceae bacterium]
MPGLDEAARAFEAAGIEFAREGLEAYGRDETMDLFSAPDLVVKPRTTAEVATVLSTAQREKIPVTARGGGTGKAGGAIPVRGGIVLSLARMDRILEIDAPNRFAVIQPGVVLQTLHEACEKKKLLYPIDMSSRGSCTLGGNIACNAGGERAVKYGVTRAYVAGLEAVRMDGSILRSGGKLAKNSAGYALHQLLVGSEGTLAVITEATLRLLPLPTHRKTLLASFSSLKAAAAAALEAEATGLNPSSVEFLERAAAALAEEMLGERLPHAEAAALLLIEVEGFSERRCEEDLEAVAQVLLENGAEDVELAPRERVWRVRHAVSEAIKRLPAYSAVDASVPRRSMPELVRRAHEAARRHHVEVVCFGHAGDGNIHVDFVRRDPDDPRWDTGVAAAVRDVLRATVELRGSISGEHGVGMLRRNDLLMQLDASTVEAMRALKAAWDPDGLLNPGKIWP